MLKTTHFAYNTWRYQAGSDPETSTPLSQCQKVLFRPLNEKCQHLFYSMLNLTILNDQTKHAPQCNNRVSTGGTTCFLTRFEASSTRRNLCLVLWTWSNAGEVIIFLIKPTTVVLLKGHIVTLLPIYDYIYWLMMFSMLVREASFCSG